MVAARCAWQEERQGWDASQLVFLDETGLNTSMGRLYGRSPKGQRCLGSLPHGHWQSFTFLAALRCGQLTAPWLIDGPMDGAMFLSWVERELAPTLKQGDLVICDNLSCHSVAGVREALAARGASLRPLPAYSPDLNPIEPAFSKLKASLRSAAKRTFLTLRRATAKALDTFTPTHCANFFRHAGYHVPADATT